jgi:hypothetical protein
MTCKVYKYGGVGECAALREPLRGVALTDKATTLTLANAGIVGATDAAGWMSIFAPIIATSTYEKGVLIDMQRGVEVTTAASEMTTSNLGFIEQTDDQHPRMTGYGLMSYSEYQSFFRAHGQSFDIPLFARNGNPIMTVTTAGTYKGFRGRIFVVKGSIPKVGADLQKECMFDIVFDDPEEWENIVEIESDFTFSELKDIVPVGLDAVVTTAYSTPNVTIKVTSRNSTTPFAGVAAAANIQIVTAENDAVCAVASVAQDNAAIGYYVVALTADLNGPVWARITAETASKRTYVSKLFRIV